MDDDEKLLDDIAALFPDRELYPMLVQHDTKGRRVMEKGRGTLTRRHPWPCTCGTPVVLRGVNPNEAYWEADNATMDEQEAAVAKLRAYVGDEYLLRAFSGTKSLHTSVHFDPATLPGDVPEGTDIFKVARLVLFEEIPRLAGVTVQFDDGNVNWGIDTLGHPVRWAGTTNMKPGAKPFTFLSAVPTKLWPIPADLRALIKERAEREHAEAAGRAGRRAELTDERIAALREAHGPTGWRALVPEWRSWFEEGTVWQPGQRNMRGTQCIRAMGTYGMSRPEIEAELEKLKAHVDDPDYDFRRSWFDSIDDKMGNPIEVDEAVFRDMEVDTMVEKLKARVPPLAAPSAVVDATAEEPVIVEDADAFAPVAWSDIANARRFARYGAQDFLYQWFGEKGRWLKWDGQKWNAEIGEQMARKAAHFVAIAVYHEVPEHETKEARKKMVQWAERSQMDTRMRAMLSEARPYLGARAEQFDADPMLLNVQNGVVDLRDGGLAPHDPALMMTRIAGAPFEPGAVAPRFRAFLERVIPDPAVRRHLQLWAGYSLTGVVTERKFRIDIGDRARNGKSTLYNIMLALLGDYGATTLFDTFGTGRAEERETPKNGLAALVGRRLVVAIESAENFKLNVNLVKSISGNDPITCRFLFKEFFTYRPQFKVWLASNNPPKIRDDNNAIWDRMQRTDWNVRIGEEEEVKGLSDIIVAEELPGILNWAVEGCLEWQRLGGLPAPPAVEKATRDYREDEFLMSEFIDDSCEREAGASVRLDVLYNQYKVWHVSTGQTERPLTRNMFGRVMRQRFKPGKTQGERTFQGLRLRRA